MSVENPHIIFVPNNSGYSSLQLAQRLAAREMWSAQAIRNALPDASRNRDFDLTHERSSGERASLRIALVDRRGSGRVSADPN